MYQLSDQRATITRGSVTNKQIHACMCAVLILIYHGFFMQIYNWNRDLPIVEKVVVEREGFRLNPVSASCKKPQRSRMDERNLVFQSGK